MDKLSNIPWVSYWNSYFIHEYIIHMIFSCNIIMNNSRQIALEIWSQNNSKRESGEYIFELFVGHG